MPAVRSSLIPEVHSSSSAIASTASSDQSASDATILPEHPSPGTGGQTVGGAVAVTVCPPVLPRQAVTADGISTQDLPAFHTGQPSAPPDAPGSASTTPDAASLTSPSTQIPDGLPRAISALMLDGGTAFRLLPLAKGARRGSRSFGPALAAVLAIARAARGQWAAAPGLDLRGWEDCPREWATEGPLCECRAVGAAGVRFQLHFEGQAFLDVDTSNGRVGLQAKAADLWARGYADWADRWLALVTWLARGEECSLRSAFAMGWRTMRVELCSDFVDLLLRREDGYLFTSRAKVRSIKKWEPERADIVARLGEVETIAIGTRKSPVSMSVHMKSALLRDVEKTSLGDSIYALKWREWEAFHDDANIMRVEARFGRHGLTFAGPDKTQVDLRDPANLANRDTLALVWGYVTNHFRLFVPPKNGSPSQSRRRRYPTDERWKRVQAVGSEAGRELRQLRGILAKTQAEMACRSSGKVFDAVREWGALHDLPVDAANVGPVAAHAAQLGVSHSRLDQGRAFARVDMLREQNVEAGRSLPAALRSPALPGDADE